MRNDIECDLLGELARWLIVYWVIDGFSLVPKLINTLFAGPRYRLIGADHNTLNFGAVMQRL